MTVVFYAIYARFIIENGEIHSSSPIETKFADIGNSEEIAYQEIDNKAQTTIIFVGGLSGWSGTWQRTMEELNKNTNKKYNLLAIDLPPFGYSTADLKRGFFRNIQAERINSFRNNKRFSNVIFVAHSYGAGPVTEAVMTDPVGINKLIIVDGVLNMGEIKVVKNNFILESSVIPYIVNAISHNTWFAKNRIKSFAFKTELIDDQVAQRYTKPFTVKGNGDRLAVWLRDYVNDPLILKSTDEEEYEKLNIPVRIIWGKEDVLTPISLGENLLKRIKDGKLYPLSGVGHMPMLEDYQQFDDALSKSVMY